MSTDKIIVVFDLGPGDGGKGGVVHKLAKHNRAHTVIKVGGAQGSHGVSTGKHEFAFSQWGCGTFEGVRTHITPLMVVSPEGLLNEADGLRYCGVMNAFDLLTVNEDAICATPYHGIASRIKEMARGCNPRGTIGTGIGEAYRDSMAYPNLTIRVSDLTGDLRHKLSEVRDHQIAELDEILDGRFFPEDWDAVQDEAALLRDRGFLDHIVDRFREVGVILNIVDHDYLGQKILGGDGAAIVESSHGILTDNHYGFQPHVSAIRTLPSLTHAMLSDAGFGGEVVNIGVHRAYTVRHGAGPMPTVDSDMNDDLLPGSHKEENRYQGKVRVGPLDLVLFRYAIEVCGGAEAIDGLAITWFDQVSQNGVWHICDSYTNRSNGFFLADDRIKVFDGDPDDMSDYQHGLCSALFACNPDVFTIDVPDSLEGQFSLCDRELRSRFDIPVHLVSFGPSDQDKQMKDVP